MENITGKVFDANVLENHEGEFFDFDEDLLPKGNSSLNNTQVEVIQLDEATVDSSSNNGGVVESGSESTNSQNTKRSKVLHSPVNSTTEINPGSMLNCKAIIENTFPNLENAIVALQSIKIPYNDVLAIINESIVSLDMTYNKLSDLSYKLGMDIISSLEIDKAVNLGFDSFKGNALVIENTELIHNYASYLGYNTYLGNFYIQYLSNGRSYIQAKQNNGNWKKIKLPTGKTFDHTGSCSIFITTSAASYLLNDTSPELMRSIMLYNSGMFDGARSLFSGGVVLKDDTGQKFVINSTVSEKQLSYGSGTTKTDVVDDWKNTLANGGVILLNITARSDEAGNIINGNAHITSGVERNEETKQLEAKGGHMIAIMGVSPEGYVIFSDSLDDGTYYKKNANETPMTLEEFYDSYGGSAPTWGGDEYKCYITVQNAKKEYVGDDASLGFIVGKSN